MTDRGQLGIGGHLPSLLITLAVLAAVVATGVAVVDEAAAGIEPDSEYLAAAEAHCEQALGSEADLYIANVVGAHGGLHCEGPNDGLIHYHDVSDSEVYRAVEDGDD